MASGPPGASTVDAAWHVEGDPDIEAANATNQLQQMVVNLVLDQANNQWAAIHNLVKVTWLYIFFYCYGCFTDSSKTKKRKILGYRLHILYTYVVYLKMEHWPVKPPDFRARNTEISIYLLSPFNFSRTKTKACSFKYKEKRNRPSIFLILYFLPRTTPLLRCFTEQEIKLFN